MFLWVKAFHIIFVVAWFAGLFYLPRLFVYHAETTDTVGHERFCVMERRLSILMSIAAAGAIGCGIWLLVMLGSGWIAHNPWIHAKLALVAILVVFHGWCQMEVKKFRQRRASASPRFYRIVNEVPTVLLMGIVILAVVKPF